VQGTSTVLAVWKGTDWYPPRPWKYPKGGTSVILVRLPEADSIVVAGLSSWLTSHPDIGVASGLPGAPADVRLAVEGAVDRSFFVRLGESSERDGAPVVLALDAMPDDAVAAAAAAGVVKLLPRTAMDRGCLVAAVVAAARTPRAGAVAAQRTLLAGLADVRAASTHHPMPALDEQDLELLELLAGGWGAHEIAARRSTTHRAVITRIQVVVRRCGARNRYEAVARAARAGLV
jgi:DNA-binding NarL/FixJ family response regulator